MNRNIKERWVKALRSGDYEQGRSFLQTYDGKFCCLGVLCELAVEDGVIGLVKTGDGSFVYGNAAYTQTAYLPDDVQTWAGLHSWNPAVVHDGSNDRLADMNDNRISFD